MKNVDVLARIVAHPDTSTALISAALRAVDPAPSYLDKYSAHAHLLRAAADHPSTSPADLKTLAHCVLLDVRLDVASNPATPAAVLVDMLESERNASSVTQNILERPVYFPEVTQWILHRLEQSRLPAPEFLEALLNAPNLPDELVVPALRATVTVSQSSDLLRHRLHHRVQKLSSSHQAWVVEFAHPALMSALLYRTDLSAETTMRCWSICVADPQAEADATFYRSAPPDAVPPLWESAGELLYHLTCNRGSYPPELSAAVAKLLSVHDLSSNSRGLYFSSFARSLREANDPLVDPVRIAQEGSPQELVELAARSVLPEDAAVALVANKNVPTDLAVQVTGTHLRHSLTVTALTVRGWDEDFVVRVLTNSPGYLTQVVVAPSVHLRLVESLVQRQKERHESHSLAADALKFLPQPLWLDVSWQAAQTIMRTFPEYVAELLPYLEDEATADVFATLLVDAPDFAGTVRDFLTVAAAAGH